MKHRVVKIRSILIFLCILAHHIIITAPLPLELPANQRDYLNDKSWPADAAQANANTNHFIEPADTVNYTDYRYAGTHNAYSYPRFFAIAHQQDQSLLGQLSYGVRGLMFDTYDWNAQWPFSLVGPKNSKVCLSHTAPGFVAYIQKGVFQYQSLKFEMRRIVEFMRVNPKAVITIIFENYANPATLIKEIKEVMLEAQYDPLYRPADYNGQWPTLGWMRAHNKRLVLFTQRNYASDITFHEFTYMAENKYDTIDRNELCMPRPESRVTGPLVAFNHFKSLGITSPIVLTSPLVQYDIVKEVTTNCQAKNFAGGRYFNGYWVDRLVDSCNTLYLVQQQTAFEYINELNVR